MRDKLDKDLDLIDPINAHNFAIAEKAKKLHEVVDSVMIEAALEQKEICNLIEVYSSVAVEIAISRMAVAIASYGVQDACFVMILKGGAWVGFKLLSMLHDAGYDIPYGFIGLQSYGDQTKSCGIVRKVSELDYPDGFLKDKKVWIIDDVLDLGLTIKKAEHEVSLLGAKEVGVAVLVHKNKVTLWDTPVVGLSCMEDSFLVGCGMGMGEKYRNFTNICKVGLKKE